MLEIRWHGRGGQGSFTAARLLGNAAVLNGQFAQAFPSFGPERRGAAVLGFTRIDEAKITDRSEVKGCDHVIVLDETLMNEKVLEGLRPGGYLMINTATPEKYAAISEQPNTKLLCLDATGLAQAILKRPVANTAMLAAFIAATNAVPIESAKSAVSEGLKPSLVDANITLIETAYQASKEVLQREKNTDC
jgi:pyruvate ferredoxin oxidoreductase gamma subunit